MNLLFKIKIIKDKSGAYKYTPDFIMENIISGNAFIKKKGSISFIMIDNDILGYIDYTNIHNYLKIESVYQKKLNELHKKIDVEIDNNRNKKRNLRRMYSFITELIDKNIITSKDLSVFNEKWEEEYEKEGEHSS